MGMNYDKEPTIESFGTKLLQSGDLDPLYITLNGAKLSEDHLKRFLFAYWCCYHAGAAAYISDVYAEQYWDRLYAMAHNTAPVPTLGGRWPRGHERRHFRGDKATQAVGSYAKRFRNVENLVTWIAELTFPGQHLSYRRVRERVMTFDQFGPWIAFKIADMLERVVGIPIDFDEADVFIFDSPREAALDLAKVWSENLDIAAFPQHGVRTWPVKPAHLVHEVVETLIEYFHRFDAPPREDRPVNVQEIETILCKWKSHLNGHYPLGLDSREISEGLNHWALLSKTAEKLRDFVPVYDLT